MTAPAISRGEIWWMDWSPGRGSEQAGHRPALIIQNNVGNANAATTIVAALTTRGRGGIPVLVPLPRSESGLPQDSFVNLSQIQTIAKSRLLGRAGALNEALMSQVDGALRISLGL